jgi:hypothetical protein
LNGGFGCDSKGDKFGDKIKKDMRNKSRGFFMKISRKNCESYLS